MRRVDWSIVDVMREDARRDLMEVANSVGVSVRTVQRRLSAMTEGKAVYLVGTPNVEKVGGLMCRFLVHCPDGGKKKAVDKSILSTVERVGFSDTSPEDYSIFGVGCGNYSEADKVVAGLKALDGVQDVRLGVMKDVIAVQDWLSDEIRKRVQVN